MVDPEPPRRRRPNVSVLAAIALGLAVLVTAAVAAIVLTNVGSGRKSSTQEAARSSTTAAQPKVVTVTATSSAAAGSVTSSSSPTTATASTTETSSSATATSSSPAQLSTYSGPGYSVSYPAGWTQTRREVDKGSYFESRWVSPDDPNVWFLVDRTPGDSSSAQDGAEGVRALVSRGDSYEQLSWAAEPIADTNGWYWQFLFKGNEEMDSFLVECGTGFAILGRAPADEWDTYAQTFASATGAFHASC